MSRSNKKASPEDSREAASEEVPGNAPQWLPPRRPQRSLIILGGVLFSVMLLWLAYLALFNAV